MTKAYDIAVIGGGLAGATAALAAANAGFRTAIAAPPAPRDGRTTALMMPSLELLAEIGIWPAIKEIAAPLRSMCIIDGTSRLIRSPTVTFHASELDLDAFGYNIPNAPLLEALFASITQSDRITHHKQPLENINSAENGVHITLKDGTGIHAELLVGADGRNSLVRSKTGISTRAWQYPQTAVVLNFSHQFGHADTSNEFHTEHGPCTQVPLPGKNSSLVWANKPAETQRLLQLPVAELAVAIEERMDSVLGKVKVESKVHAFPFNGMIARSFGKGRTVLIGEAGHVFPPIGAQGLNLGLRDVVVLMEVLSVTGGPQEAEQVTSRYNRRRGSDVVSRTASVDLLNRTLLHDFLPVQLARSAGLAALASIAPLRNYAMREGLKPGGGLDLFRNR
ncbi:MAG: UbiH/UbiF family hydroxylase [Pseudomonadota bacterium]